jgi:DHA1 family bicyclomycin/chloramphenicol resistance-like MFS transporter
MAGSSGTLIAWRVLQALGASASVVIARAIVRDLYRGERAAKLMSTLMTVMAIAPLIGPSAGGLILHVATWRAIFWVLVAVGLATLLALWALPETLPPHARTTAPLSDAVKAYGRLLRHRTLLGYGSVAGFYFGASFAYVTGSPFLYITYLHLSPQWYGAAFAAGIVGIMLANQANARLLARFSGTTLIRAGATTAAMAAMVATLDTWGGWGGIAGMVAPLLVVVAANGFISANAIAGALSHFDEGAGAVSALLGSVQYGTGMIGSALVGYFAGSTPRSLACVIAAMCIGCMLCAWWLLPSDAIQAKAKSKKGGLTPASE